jgi:hypothetical protein
MNYIGQIFDFIQKLLVWWVTVMPWEEAVFIRGGKRMKVIRAGIHLRIPFYDQAYLQTTRLRVMTSPPQTVTTKDGTTITIVMALGYSIVDIKKLYLTLFQPESTLCNILQSSVAEAVREANYEICTPAFIEAKAGKDMEIDDYGLKFEYIKATGFSQVKVYRLIQDNHWNPDSLNTVAPKP